METGEIPVESLNGGIDLHSTLASGQSFLWQREAGGLFDAPNDADWYSTTIPRSEADRERPEVVRVRHRSGAVEWEASFDAHEAVKSRLRLEDDVPEILQSILEETEDALLQTAFDTHSGLRIVNDPAFPCLISFICSAQMRVARIHQMQQALSKQFGTSVEFDGREYHAFPTPTQLTEASEDELRDLKLGYRAPYVKRTAHQVVDEDVHPDDFRGVAYEDARDGIQVFTGVGDKVADCVLLYSLDYLEAVPLDTWIQTAIEEHYPECARSSYSETSRALRAAFGGDTAGYAQTYVFHHLRTLDE